MTKFVPFLKAVPDIALQALWLKATDGVYVDGGSTLATDGQTVQQWNDQTANVRHATQGTSGSRPTYRATGFNGLPGVEFTEWKDMATASFLDAAYDAAATLFYIGEMTSTGQHWAVGEADGQLGLAECDEWNRFDAANTGSPTYWYRGAQTVGAGNIRCVGISYDGTTMRTIINGHLIKEARTGALGAAGVLTIGTRTGLSAWWEGVIGEVALWNSAATDAQMRATCAAMLARWGAAAPTTRKVIAYVGDSQTYYAGEGGRWPQVIASAIGHVNQSHTIVATGGASLAFIGSIAAAWVDPVYDATATLNVNLIWAGTNDLAGGETGAAVWASLQSYCNARRAAGWDKIIVLTALPRSAVGDNAGHEALRQAFNTLVRTNYASIADGLADVAADSRIGDDGDELDTTYYDADRVHLNTAGHAVVAGIVQPILEGVL